MDFFHEGSLSITHMPVPDPERLLPRLMLVQITPSATHRYKSGMTPLFCSHQRRIWPTFLSSLPLGDCPWNAPALLLVWLALQWQDGVRCSSPDIPHFVPACFDSVICKECSLRWLLVIKTHRDQQIWRKQLLSHSWCEKFDLMWVSPFETISSRKTRAINPSCVQASWLCLK